MTKTELDALLKELADLGDHAVHPESLAARAAAALRELEKDAERGRYIMSHVEWHRVLDDDRPEDNHAYLKLRVPYHTDLSCYANVVAAVDALKKPQ